MSPQNNRQNKIAFLTRIPMSFTYTHINTLIEDFVSLTKVIHDNISQFLTNIGKSHQIISKS